MNDDFLTSPRSGRSTVLKIGVCAAVVALLAAAFWYRWIPGRPVPPEWARGNATPDNSLSYDTEEDVPSSIADDVEVVSSPSFLFTMGEGSAMRGFDVLQVWTDGRCEYTYPDPSSLPGARLAAASRPAAAQADLATWRRARFNIDRQTVADLRRLLVDVGYFDLKRSYRAPIEDGTQWFVRVHVGTHEKAVWCDNHFPRHIMAINDFVRDKIVDPHQSDRSLAVPVNLPPNWIPDFGIPRSAPDDKTLIE